MEETGGQRHALELPHDEEPKMEEAAVKMSANKKTTNSPDMHGFMSFIGVSGNSWRQVNW